MRDFRPFIEKRASYSGETDLNSQDSTCVEKWLAQSNTSDFSITHYKSAAPYFSLRILVHMAFLPKFGCVKGIPVGDEWVIRDYSGKVIKNGTIGSLLISIYQTIVDKLFKKIENHNWFLENTAILLSLCVTKMQFVCNNLI